VTKEDITHVLDRLFDAYYKQHLRYESMVNYVGITLFGAFTGQRIEATISKLTAGQVRDALQTNPPVLHVTPNQDKIRMEHYVPLHPDLREILMQLVFGKEDNEHVFEFVGYQMWLKNNPISLSRVPTKRFTPSDLRKFAEQYAISLNEVRVIAHTSLLTVSVVSIGRTTNIPYRNTSTQTTYSTGIRCTCWRKKYHEK
jgi:hypothetical protein